MFQSEERSQFNGIQFKACEAGAQVPFVYVARFTCHSAQGEHESTIFARGNTSDQIIQVGENIRSRVDALVEDVNPIKRLSMRIPNGTFTERGFCVEEKFNVHFDRCLVRWLLYHVDWI